MGQLHSHAVVVAVTPALAVVKEVQLALPVVVEVLDTSGLGHTSVFIANPTLAAAGGDGMPHHPWSWHKQENRIQRMSTTTLVHVVNDTVTAAVDKVKFYLGF